MNGFGKNETRTSSESSELTRDGPRDSAEQEETSSLDFPVTESISTEWTNEKHSLYLKSMEASFVNQLYNSMDFLGWRSQKENLSDSKSSRQTHRNSLTSSGQFKVLRHGCWQKLNFERYDFQQHRVEMSHGLLTSPWIRHFKTVGKPQVAVSPSPHEGTPLGATKMRGKKAMSCGTEPSSKHFRSYYSHQFHDNTADSNTEASDQNFHDEHIEGENTSSICSSKKMKTLTTDASGSDQVVPFGASSGGSTQAQQASHNRR